MSQVTELVITALDSLSKSIQRGIEIVPVGIAMFDSDMLCIAASRYFLEEYEIAELDMIGRRLYDVVPDLPCWFCDVCQRCLLGAVERNDEEPIHRADGRTDYLRWVCQPLHLDNGVIGGVVLFTQDVTAEVLGRREARRWADAVMHAGFGITIVDATTNSVLYANPAFAAQHAMRPDEVVGHTVLSAYPPSEHERVTDLLSDIETVGHAVFEADRLRRDGSVFPAMIGVTYVRPADGSTPYRIGTILDATKLREAEARALRMQRLATLGQTAAELAHELNQPLAVIGMAAENAIAMIEDGEDAAVVVGKLNGIIKQAERAGEIVRHVRMFGHRGGGPAVPTRIADAIDGALAVAHSRLLAGGITVHWAVPADLPDVRLPPVQLEQVLTNLLLNSADAYAASGAAARWIRIAAWRVDSDVVLAFSDAAGGIPEAIRERIFEPFFTTKTASTGTGLGLSICYDIVTRAGGSLTVRNVEGGVEFDIYLPALLSEPS